MNRFVQGLFLVCLISISTSCVKPKIQVALLTKLDSGSIIGISEMAAIKEFEQTHPSSPIQVVPFDDGWDPIRTKDAYRVVRDKDIRFLITSHTSTCAKVYQALELLHLALNSGATTPEQAKTWLLSQKTIETRLGPIFFDRYGESSSEYSFITNIPEEFN